MPHLLTSFTTAMGRLGPWSPHPIAVAVSGGADSLALTLLAHDWCRAQNRPLLAFTVDHALRPESTAEAHHLAQTLERRGIPCRILTLDLTKGPALAARAREARYQALFAACRESRIIDLLLGHHARDQAETLLIRQASASGPNGMAGMAAVSLRGGIRLIRPLLAIPPAELRAFLEQRRQAWIEDPSNANPAATRNRLRLTLQDPASVQTLLDQAATAATARQTAEAATAAWLAQHCAIFPGGYAWIAATSAPEPALTALIQTISGTIYPPRGAAIARLAPALHPATLHGTRLIAARNGFWLARESPAAAIPAEPNTLWDNRFRVLTPTEPGLTIGALGPDTPRWRDRSPLPAAVLKTLPVLRRGNEVLGLDCKAALFQPPRPAAPAPFRT